MKPNGLKGQIAVVFGIAAFVVLVIALALSIRIVRYGNVKLVTRFGALTGTVLEPGLHFVVPIVNGTVNVPTQIRSYETSENPAETKADFPDFTIKANTSDGQQIDVSYTAIFHISSSNALEVTRNTGKMEAIVENVVKAQSRSWARKLAQNYSAESLYSGTGVQEYEDAVRQQLSVEYAKYNVSFDEFLVRKVGFAQEYVDAIEQKQIAEQGINTQKFLAQQAEQQAVAKVNTAKGDAEAVVIAAKAEAEALNIKGAAIRSNPEILKLQFINALSTAKWMMIPWDQLQGYMPLQPSVQP